MQLTWWYVVFFDLVSGLHQSFPPKLQNHCFYYISCYANVQVRYSRSETHSEKLEIAKSILFALKSLNPPSRFLERDSETKMWHGISDKMALQKIAHRIRDTKRLMLRRGRKAMLRWEAETRSHRPVLTRMQSERTPRWLRHTLYAVSILQHEEANCTCIFMFLKVVFLCS